MEKILRHTLIVGLSDKDSKKQKYSSIFCTKMIMGIVGDCTITDVTGCYTHEDGTIVVENSLKVEMLFKTDNEVLDYAKQIKELLNQESIVFSKDYIESTLI